MRRNGFTLIEMSIVLVIIGIIIGGILGGQELLRVNELNRIIVDKDRLGTAIDTFKAKYNALPGDIRNATDYWGTASGGCPNGARTGTQTCNGNGDGVIGGSWGCGNPANAESLLVFQHLALSGIISGTFTGYSTGYAGTTYCSPTVGINVPTTSILGASFFPFGMTTSLYAFFNVIPKNALMFGAPTALSNNDIPAGAVIKAKEAQSIDIKYDDGKPGYGNIIASTNTTFVWAPNCTTGANADTALYNVGLPTISCALLFQRR